jgi:hypothetical protein
MDLGVLPRQEGDLEAFKKTAKKKLESYKIRNQLLFPLRTTLSITILLLPPLGQGIDLDNLAKRIIPLINEIMQPPATFLHSVDLENLKNDEMKRRLLSVKSELRRIPQYSISRYEIIEMPRISGDFKDGFIKMYLGDGLESQNIWDRLDERLDVWSDYVDRL